MYKVSSVSYTNSIPFVYGLKHGTVANSISLSLDIPSLCAQKVISQQVDIGLVPVAAIPLVPNANIISNYCIGAVGRVNTVLLYSEVPLAEIKTILLDFQSRTSIALVQILCKEYWHISPQFIQASEGYEAQIGENIAGVVIGDRCFNLTQKYSFNYDLSQAWYGLTGLPFVFACWVANKPLPEAFIKEFNSSLEIGLNAIAKARQELLNPNVDDALAKDYLENVISYTFDESKKIALDLFLEKLKILTLC